jgi:PKD repeat protein
MKKINLFLLCCGTLLVTSARSQDYLRCGTTEANARYIAEHPEMLPRIKAAQEELDRAAKAGAGARKTSAGPVYVIPIVFHIVHNYGSENISDAQIRDQVDILNRDFRKKNPDTTQIVPEFRNIATDSEIEFRLATKDPNGNCTDGIDRIVSTKTNNADDASKFNPWDSKKYLNVWVVRTIGQSGVAGYAYYPGTASPAVDGILILSNYIGSIGTGAYGTSRALTHEVGHYLNLPHTWGNTNDPGVACGNDGVNDTPVTRGWTSCNLSNSAICTPGVKENVQNFMEYAYCSRMFTNDQKTRMRTALVSSAGGRNNLWIQSNLTATGTDGSPAPLCTPVSDFSGSQYVCTGNLTSFTDRTWRGSPSSYKWVLPGADSTVAYSKSPTVRYNTPGAYDVTLITTNAAGSDTIVRKNFIHVNSSSTAQNAVPFTESFEASTLQAINWTTFEDVSDNVSWNITSTAAVTGTSSAKLNRHAATKSGNVHSLISPSFNTTLVSSPVLSFKTSYAQRSNSSSDVLKVFYSSNCGLSWVLITGGNLSASALSAGVIPSSFTPANSTQWKSHKLALPSTAQKQSVIFRFEFTVGSGGNNLYLEDININSLNPTSLSEAVIDNLNLSVFPNPAENTSTVSFSLLKSENVSVKVYDITGREVTTLVAGATLPAGDHRYALNIGSKGIYFVKLFLDNNAVKTSKLVVN